MAVIEQFLNEVDHVLRAVFPPAKRMTNHACPGNSHKEADLSPDQKRHIAGLMRVNHAGEVCAQALYRGQALTAHLHAVKAAMQQAAEEELDHLAWCEQRLQELESQPTVLNGVWYAGAWLIGAVAGMLGDRWSLGFVLETERQVSQHLVSHLQKLPSNDHKTQAILSKMHDDEMQHANMACRAGAAELPEPIKLAMSFASKLLTHSSYYL